MTATDARSVPAATLSVAYSSRATEDFSDSDLVELLTLSRRNNIRLGLTGVLLYRGGRFLQYLEGPEQAVAERIEIIAADTRHDDFQIRFRGSVGGLAGGVLGTALRPGGSGLLGAILGGAAGAAGGQAIDRSNGNNVRCR